jgi:uncharacterized protein YndB with AHSA1/START domain
VPAAPSGTDVLEHDVLVTASPETVFSYFTDPAKLVRWMGDEATLDPRPGGVCRIAFGRGASVALGEFVEVVPYSRVVFSWGWETELLALPPASTMVEVTLSREGDGTRVRLTHRRLPEASVAFHRLGWTHYLPRLAVVASGGDPGPDTLPGDVVRALPGS